MYNVNKINEFFDITENTVNDMDNAVMEVSNDNIIIDGDVFELDTLKKDFNVCRETLLETIKAARQIVTGLSYAIGPGTSGSVISSFSEVVKSINESVALLSRLYLDIEKLKGPQLAQGGHIQNQINVISTNINDVIKELRKS